MKLLLISSGLKRRYTDATDSHGNGLEQMHRVPDMHRCVQDAVDQQGGPGIHVLEQRGDSTRQGLSKRLHGYDAGWDEKGNLKTGAIPDIPEDYGFRGNIITKS